MKLPSSFGLFPLTRSEQRTVAFIVLAIMLGLITQHYRHREPKPLSPPNDFEQPASPSPAGISTPR